jgi:hypothetical protein
MPVRRTEEGERLRQALVDRGRRGLRTHCSDPVLGDLWVSEHRADRAEAVKLCVGCPVIVECGAAAVARRERHYVWGGRDFTRVPAKIGQPPNPNKLLEIEVPA